MNGVKTIAKREIDSYFNSPLAYIFIVAFLLACGILFFFIEDFFVAGIASMRGYFALMPLVFSILVPSITMRLWAEERRQGTFELLITMPFHDWQIVLGKYLAAMFVIFVALVLSIPVPVFLSAFGRFDFGVIFTEYLGALLMASAAVSIGQALSGATRNQMSAFMATIAVLLFMSLIANISAWVDLPAFLSSVINWCSLSFHFSSFSRGVLDTRDIAYFVLITIAGILATVRAIQKSKWS